MKQLNTLPKIEVDRVFVFWRKTGNLLDNFWGWHSDSFILAVQLWRFDLIKEENLRLCKYIHENPKYFTFLKRSLGLLHQTPLIRVHLAVLQFLDVSIYIISFSGNVFYICRILYIWLFITLNNANNHVWFEVMHKYSEQIKATCLPVEFISSERNKWYGETAQESSGSVSAFCLNEKHEPLCFSSHSCLVISLSVSSTLYMYKSFFGEFNRVWVLDEFMFGGLGSCLIDRSPVLVIALFCLSFEGFFTSLNW